MTDPAKRCCGNCSYSGACDPGDKQLFCHRYPPVVLGEALFLPPVIPGGPPRASWYLNVTYPPGTPDRPACGEFKPKVQLTN